MTEPEGTGDPSSTGGEATPPAGDNPADADGQTGEGDTTASEATSPDGTTDADEQENEATAYTAATQNADEPEGDEAPATQAAESRATAGDFSVEGGTDGTDYELLDGVLHIKTSTPLTISMADGKTTTAQTIEVDAGVKADLTLAGVTISTVAANTRAPINLVTNSDEDGDGVKVTNANQIQNKTMLYLTIAENTVNTLTCGNVTASGSAGIRCGWGSILVIDDAITNVRAGGSKFNLDDIVTPEGGMVPEDVTLIGGQTLKAGETPTSMDVANCVLNVTGGGWSAGIGSGPNENAGTLIFNGGTITSRVLTFITSDYARSNGAGIGGGAAGSGTVMTFNGGTIDAYGGSCGTGIGSGLGFHSTAHRSGQPKSDAINIPVGEANSGGYSFDAIPRDVSWFCCTGNDSCPEGVHALSGFTFTNYFTVAGDITVNGGFVKATSGAHGNAMGQSCAHGPSSNHNHVIRVTGGTVLTTILGQQPGSYNPSSGTRPPVASLGASHGYTIVTGGSVFLTTDTKTGKPAFQGIGGTAYNTHGIEDWSDVEAMGGSLPDADKVQMLTIDLSSEFGDGASDTDKTVPVTKWKLEIDNITQEYGSPSYLDKGLLYLWLPESATGKNVTVTMSYRDKDGVEHDIEPMYVEEVGGSQGSTLKRYIDIDVDKLTPEQQEYFAHLTKDYDGLPFAPLAISADKPIEFESEQGNKYTLTNPDKIETSYQPYDEVGGSPLPGSSVTTGTSMPADTGTFRVQLVSKEYAAEGSPFANNYWGHRITGWAQINPVPAVLAVEGVQWGNLADDGTWTPVTDSSSNVAGNRLKLTFNIRSANTTATTCAAPTGAFQVRIDGKDVGDPIRLVADSEPDAVGGSAHSTIAEQDISVESTTGGTETRHATVVTYYLDPANRDGLLELLEDAASGGEHTVTIEYIADKNYIQGVDENPDNAQDESAFIVPVQPGSDVTPEGPATEVTPDPNDPPAGTDPDDPSVQVVRKIIEVNYGDFHKESDPDLADTFSLALKSNSSAPITYANSDATVVDYVRDEDGNPVMGEDGKIQLRVLNCGETVLTMDQGANALYTGTRYIIVVRVNPDPTIKPQVQIRLTQRNLTALAEAASAQVAAAAQAVMPLLAENAAVATAATPRATSASASTPPRPGDIIEYTVTGLNLTPGSSWNSAKLTDAISDNLEFIANVEMAPNYTTRTDKSTALGTAAFYEGFDWDALNWAPVGDGDYTFAASTLSKDIDPVLGGHSTSVRFQAKVSEDKDLGSRPADDTLPEITNTPGGEGGADDIVVVGDDAQPDPNDPDNPQPANPGTVAPVPVLPKDPTAADIVTTVTVEVKEHLEEHDDDRILVGDVLTVTATSTNQAPETKLADAVIRVTLPEGIEPKAGTIVLTDAQGNTYPVPDSAYDPATGIVAVNAGDLYGGESATLTFDVEVVSTAATRPAPDGTETRPTDLPITGGTLGTTPTDEWEREHPNDPDATPDPAGDPKPGTPFVPTKPWPEIENEWVVTPPATDPTMPPVLPSSPTTEDKDGVPADIKLTKTADNVSRTDGTTRVGDTVRYTVTVANSKAHSMWYNAVIRDELPTGMEYIAGTAKMTGADGVERAVPDSAYDSATRVLAVKAGDIPGGASATLVFDVKVTEAAIDVDTGNVASAHGTTPDGVDVDSVTNGAPRPVPGEAFAPAEGWDQYMRENPGVSNAAAPAYAPGTDARGGVLPADDGRLVTTVKRPLAQTGDGLLPMMGLLALCALGAAGVAILAVMRRRPKHERNR